jgi:NHLM bacteriocin system ABC transporter ATP-binding protein
MGLYSEQIAARIRNDADAFEQSIVELASAVTGHNERAANFLSDRESTKNATQEILKYFHVVPVEISEGIKDTDEQLEFLLRPSGIMRRKVELTGAWYKDGIGPLLGQTKDGRAIALIPGKISGYTYFDYGSGKRVRVTKGNSALIDGEAICFYNPLPSGKLSIRDLLIYMVRSLAVSDYVMAAAVTLAATLVGLVSPYANKLLFGNVVTSASNSMLFGVTALLLGATVSTALITMTNQLILSKIGTKINMSMQSASMARLLSLPTAFYKEHNSGEVAQNMNSLNSLCDTLHKAVLGTGLTSLFSLIYIGQIASLAPSMAVPALIIIFIQIGFSVFSTLMSMKTVKKRIKSEGALSGLVFSLFRGIQKIKLAGAERRAFAKWAKLYSKNAALNYSPPFIVKYGTAIGTALGTAGMVVLFLTAGLSHLSVSDYMAFNVSYGMVTGALTSLSGLTITFAQIKPVLDMSKPLMETEPEVSADKKMLTRLSGSIDINNISFRYRDDMPLVLDDFTLRIRPGQYLAIVGASGCGKSTLLRLLLGFEKPQKGAIYYDRHDINTVDLKSLRMKIGCVIQNGSLMSGSIFQNISISKPNLTPDEAWEAAEMAGFADDIRNMPMGMHTMVSEGGGGISGGQRQRLLIARAVAPKPKILMLDEATSALDNITQKHVSDSLSRLKCTRIVIAHRLSTIKQCDRIIMLEKGKIVEDGTYDELTALNGKFAELVERQRLDG